MKKILTAVVCFILVVNVACQHSVSGDMDVSISPPFPEVYKTLGQDLVVVCTALNWKPVNMSFSWIDPAGRNMSVINSPRISISTMHMYMYSKRTVLHLTGIVASDAGKYTCRVQTSNGSSLSTKDVDIQLRIYESQNNVISKEDVTAVRNSSVVLQCSGLREKEFPLVWEHNGKDIYNEVLLTYGPSLPLYQVQFDKLHVARVNESTAGIYTCRMRDENTGVIADQIFNLTTEPLIRVVVSSPELRATPHSRVLLGCVVKSKQRTTVEWKREGNILYNTDRYRQTKEGFQINDVSKSDAGRYYCRATDSDGHESEDFIDLTVKTATLDELFEVQGKTFQALNTVIDIQKEQLLLQQQQLQLQQEQQRQQRPSRKIY